MLKGFSFLELMLTIVILGILLAVGVPTYSKWLKKNNIVNDTKTIFSLLTKARMRSFADKISYSVCLLPSGVEVQLLKSGTVLEKVSLKTSFSSNFAGGCVSFSSSGFSTSVGTFYSISSLSTNCSCVVVSKTRISMGAWDGVNCQIH